MKILLALLLSVTALPVLAATRNVTLKVLGMTCAACPITVKTALSRVQGVKKVTVHFRQREVVVTFDDSRTNAKALTATTADAGYPSRVKQGG